MNTEYREKIEQIANKIATQHTNAGSYETSLIDQLEDLYEQAFILGIEVGAQGERDI